MDFARGKNTRAICDRCGLEYKLHQLRMEWTNLKVCSDCWEPKHPQLEVKARPDRVAVRDPRPGQHSREDMTVRFKLGLVSTGFVGETGGVSVSEDNVAEGQEITSALGDISLFIGTRLFIAGVETDMQLGNAYAAIDELANVTGYQINTNVPTVGVSVDDMVMPAGLASTTSLGTPTVYLDSNGWGFDTWGNGAWGN